MSPSIIVIAIILFSLLIGIALLSFSLRMAESLLKRKFSISVVFKNFREKIWMTFGLGIVFFGLYLLTIFGLWSLQSASSNQSLFILLYKHPVELIYLGLLCFAFITMGIYLARMVIKYLYNKRY